MKIVSHSESVSKRDYLHLGYVSASNKTNDISVSLISIVISFIFVAVSGSFIFRWIKGFLSNQKAKIKNNNQKQ